MQPDPPRPPGAGDHPTPNRRLDARPALIATLAYVVAVVATPAGWWVLLAGEALLLLVVVVRSGVPLLGLGRRWLAFLPLVGFLAAMVSPTHPARATIGLAGVVGLLLARNSLAFLALTVLAHVTPTHHLLTAMARLGAPEVLVATLHFMDRYRHVFADELGRMVQARRARTFRRAGRLDWGLLSGLVGVLLLRALERGERVHAAMVARGWDGTFRGLDGADAR